ncbi:MAG TPA: monofunctional biosynthetic peptidoglycan transglycosylase [Fibrobacteres bacterium]|nr:monofunctional biosynthetic peptidoglycan transglycosylase [Fibrobacterota bacterium]
MGTAGSVEFKAKASGKQKRSLFQRLLHWFRIAVLVFVGSSVAVVLLYRFVPPPATPLMLLRLGNQLEEGKKFRLEKNWKPLEKISPYMAASVIISEDQEFFEHHGFDFDAIRSAFKRNQTHKRIVGASTITQQTAKNLFLWPARSWLRKGLEVYFTILLEVFWSKHRILEVYLNIIETGDGVYGVDAAARRYFHSNARALNAEQSAMIAAILPKPRSWAPPNATLRVYHRQAWVLRQMGNFVGRPELR